MSLVENSPAQFAVTNHSSRRSVKNDYGKILHTKNIKLKNELENLEHKNELLSKNIDHDYLDILYRTKLKLGTKDEILIKLK